MNDNTNENEKHFDQRLALLQVYKTCEVCGKVFYRLDYVNYLYKLQFEGKMHFYCRYNCWRQAQKEQEKKQSMLKHSNR